MEKDKKFGEILRERIKGIGYKTYEIAAEDLGISLSYLNQLMRSERQPSFELLQKIHEKLKMVNFELKNELIEKEKEEIQLKEEILNARKYNLANLPKEELVQILIRLSESQSKQTDEIAEKVAQKLAESKPTVSKQDTKNLSEKDKLILEITSGLPLLEINKLKFIRDRVLAGNSGSIKSKKPVNS